MSSTPAENGEQKRVMVTRSGGNKNRRTWTTHAFYEFTLGFVFDSYKCDYVLSRVSGFCVLSAECCGKRLVFKRPSSDICSIYTQRIISSR